MANSGEPDERPAERTPLGEEVERVVEHIRSLVDLVRYDPPTPGVVATTRRNLARELRLEPLALRRACAPSVPEAVRVEIDSVVRGGEDLARAVEDGGEPRQVTNRIGAHLDVMLELADRVSAASAATPSRLATEFARARDIHVYGL